MSIHKANFESTSLYNMYMDGWLDGWMDGWVDGWMDEYGALVE